MANPTPVSRSAYPRSSQVQRAIRSAQKSGMEISAVDIGPDGSIRLSGRESGNQIMSEFERWDAEGRL